MKINQLLENNNSTEFKKLFPNTTFYRGSEHYSDGEHIKFEERKVPRDTFLPFHNSVNKLAVQRVGYPIRNYVFMTQEKSESEIYGSPFIVYPNDGFMIFVSGYEDMTSHLRVSNWAVLQYAKMNLIASLKDIDLKTHKILTNIFNPKNSYLFENKDLDDFKEIALDAISLYKGDATQYEKNLDDLVERLKEKAVTYVGSVRIVNSEEDMSSDDQHKEFILYSPNGFTVKED